MTAVATTTPRRARAALRNTALSMAKADAFDMVADLLADPPEVVLDVAVYDLLLWVPRIGCSRARSILMHTAAAVIPETRRVRALTVSDTRLLVEHLRRAAVAAGNGQREYEYSLQRRGSHR